MSDARDGGRVLGRRQRPCGAVPVDVISVQSQVVYGHAGNSAAVMPLRQLGLRVAALPTTILSNTPFYPTTRGRVLPREWFAELLLGARERALHRRAGVLLSGYLGSAENGALLAEWMSQIRAEAPGLKYVLDPVIGDTHTGLYVDAALEAVFRDRLLPQAWLATPNAFELARLSGIACADQSGALAAARQLLAAGPRWVVAHSIPGGDGQWLTIAVSRDEAWRIGSPELTIDVSGTGDVLCALLVGFLLEGQSMPLALERAVAGVHAALEQTLALDREELEVAVAAQAARAMQSPRFPAISIS